MKTIKKLDFSMNVRTQELEENTKYSDFYKGIYSVSLNKLIDIVFIPEFEKTEHNWPPVLPNSVDEPHSKQEARLWTIGLSTYTVTPSLSWAGRKEIIPLSSSSNNFQLENSYSDSGIIFYTTPSEFSDFSQELSEISKQTLSAYSYVKLSEVSSLLVSQFLLKTIIESKEFSLRDLEILKR